MPKEKVSDGETIRSAKSFKQTLITIMAKRPLKYSFCIFDINLAPICAPITPPDKSKKAKTISTV